MEKKNKTKYQLWKFKWKEGMDKKEKLSVIERMILVYSYIYYKKDKNIISDAKYDGLSYMLTKFISKYPKSFKNTDYYYVFYDFDGSTGFDLFARLKKKDKKRISQIANIILSKGR